MVLRIVKNDEKNTILSISEIQQASLNVLDELDRICRNNDIQYTITYGTLIGAIRHKGFIPWDDDVDILLPRSDYERLKNCIKTGLSGNLVWCDRASVKNYPYCISRVTDMNYRYCSTVPNQKPFDIGIFVDVYPLDHYCSTESAALKLGRRVWIKNREFDIYLNPNKTSGIAKKIIRNILSAILRCIHGKDWSSRIDDEIFELIKKNTNDSDQIVGVISQHEWRELMRRDWFESYTDVEFEHRKFLMCNGYHELLTSIYGDYMKLPEKEKQVPTHDYCIVKRQTTGKPT